MQLNLKQFLKKIIMFSILRVWSTLRKISDAGHIQNLSGPQALHPHPCSRQNRNRCFGKD